MSLTSPPLGAGAAPRDGSPRIGYVPPHPVSNPRGSLIGSSLGLDRPPAPVAGSKAPGLVSPGVRPGLVRPGVDRPGVVPDVRPGGRPGEVSPGLARSGEPRPGVPRLLGLVAPVRLGIGGRLTPNCDNPCVSAPISSPGRSVMDAARTNSWCTGAGLAVRSQTAM